MRVVVEAVSLVSSRVHTVGTRVHDVFQARTSRFLAVWHVSDRVQSLAALCGAFSQASPVLSRVRGCLPCVFRAPPRLHFACTRVCRTITVQVGVLTRKVLELYRDQV